MLPSDCPTRKKEREDQIRHNDHVKETDPPGHLEMSAAKSEQKTNPLESCTFHFILQLLQKGGEIKKFYVQLTTVKLQLGGGRKTKHGLFQFRDQGSHLYGKISSKTIGDQPSWTNSQRESLLKEKLGAFRLQAWRGGERALRARHGVWRVQKSGNFFRLFCAKKCPLGPQL